VKPHPVAAIIGWPVGHSRSPALHGHWLARYGIAGAYVPLAVAPERVEEALRALPALGFAGANVTVPHKEVALAVSDFASERAHRIGAANTLVVREGRLEADNTDGYGFLENLNAGAPDWARDKPALVLGAGGASRAVIDVLVTAGVPEIRLANRTRSRAERMAARVGQPVTVVDWAEARDAGEGVGLVVNTTSMGMVGQPPLDFDFAACAAGAVATDLVYAPLRTEFLEAAARHGMATVDGLGMLLHQGRPGFKAWFGHDPEVDEALREAVLAA
jgi:shikimate dehydrogenase